MKPRTISDGIAIIAGIAVVTIILLGVTTATCFGWIEYRCDRMGIASLIWIIALFVFGIYVLLDSNERNIQSR